MSEGTDPHGHDDRVIGVAFRRSVAVAAAAGVAVLLWRLWPAPAPVPAPEAPLPDGPAALPAPASSGAFRFEDATEAWGIDFRRTAGADGRRFLPETMGGGIAVWDVDSDGDLDLLFVDGDAWPDAPAGSPRGAGIALYLNDRSERGETRFVRAGDTGLDRPWQGMGIALADGAGDAPPEIVATGVGGIRHFVPVDAGGGPRWRDATAESGLDRVGGWTTAAAFADFDGDLDLDLLVARYVEWSPEIDLAVGYTLTGIGRAYGAPTGFAGTDLVYLERGSDGRFTDRTAERGLLVRTPSTGGAACKALGLVIDDVEGDGDLDVFVANDTVRNLLFLNDGRGSFREDGIAAGVAFDRNGSATGAMGCDSSHLRNDRALAIAVGNFANEPCSLYVTPGDGRFADDAILDGISAATRRPLTFGVVFADLDADGREDLVLANGHIEPRIAEVQPTQRLAQPAQAFRNVGGSSGATFAEVPADSLGALSAPAIGRGLAWGDLDADGRLDLVLAQSEGAPRVLRNASVAGRWVSVRLRDGRSAGNASAIGAQVTLRTKDGAAMERTVMPTRSYLSQVPPVAWFGVGERAPEEVDVRWPDGERSVHPVSVPAGAPGRSVVIERAPQPRRGR